MYPWNNFLKWEMGHSSQNLLENSKSSSITIEIMINVLAQCVFCLSPSVFDVIQDTAQYHQCQANCQIVRATGSLEEKRYINYELFTWLV